MGGRGGETEGPRVRDTCTVPPFDEEGVRRVLVLKELCSR